MGNATHYGDRKAAILEALRERAKSGQKIYYKALGESVGMPAQGPWKKLLDEIALDERNAGRPDITYLVINARTDYPSQINFENSRQLTPEQKTKADRIQKDVFEWHKQKSKSQRPTTSYLSSCSRSA